MRNGEAIYMNYQFNDDNQTSHEVTSRKENNSLKVEEVCEMFLDFMESAGYSTSAVIEYFRR